MVPLPVTTKTIRSNPDSHIDLAIFKMSAFKDNPFDAKIRQFQFQITAALLFLHFIRSQRRTLLLNPFTDYKEHLESNSNVTNQSNWFHDYTKMLNAKTTAVPELSRPILVPLTNVVTFSLSSTNNNTFWTNRYLKNIANASETLYQTPSAPKRGPCAGLPSLFSIATVNPISYSPMITQIYTVPFVAVNKSVTNIDGNDQQKTPEE